MLINFSPILLRHEPFITADETEILVQCEKLDNEYRLYGGKSDAVYKSELLSTNATAKL